MKKSKDPLSTAFMLPTLPHGIFGREKEIQSFFQSLDRKQVFCIQGMPGIGKTFFMLYLAQQLREMAPSSRFKNKTFFFEVKEGWQSRTFIDQLNGCLKKTGAMVGGEAEPDPFEPLQDKVINLISFLNSNTFAIFIDDFHLFSPESQLELLRPIIKYLRSSKIIFTSCTEIQLLPMEKLGIWETKLRELEPNSALSLFQEFIETDEWMKIREKEREAIYSRTGGHPFTIKLLASVFLSSHRDLENLLDLSSPYSQEVRSFLVQRIFQHLTEPEKACLSLLLCLRRSLDPSLLEQASEKSLSDSVGILRGKLLIDLSPEGRIRLHSLIRRHGNQLVLNRDIHQNHAWWAQFFLKLIQTENCRNRGSILVEYIYHLLMAGAPLQAQEAMGKYLPEMYLRGSFDEILALLQLFHEKNISLSQRILITKGKILYLQGKWQESQDLFHNLREHAEKAILPKIFICLGHIEVCRNHINEAVKLYQESLSITKRQKQIPEQAETLFYLGDAHFFQRHFNAALTDFQKSRLLYESIGDVDGMTDADMKQASVLTTLNEIHKARALLLHSAQIYDERQNPGGLAEVNLLLASLAFREAKYPEALIYLDKANPTFLVQRNVLKMLTLDILRGKILFFQNEINSAWEILSRAADIAALHDRIDELAECSLYLLQIGRRILTHRGESWESLETIQAWKKEFGFDLLFDPAEGFAYFPPAGKVSLRGKPRLIQLLTLFMGHPGKKFKPADLYQAVWEQEFDPEIHDSNVRSHISRLRQTIEPDQADRQFNVLLKSPVQNEYYFNHQITFCLIKPNSEG